MVLQFTEIFIFLVLLVLVMTGVLFNCFFSFLRPKVTFVMVFDVPVTFSVPCNFLCTCSIL